mgnify:CR=1 FL=1
MRLNSTARRSRSDVARDLDDWLDAFDQTPVTPPTRQSAWIVATSWVLIAAPLLWQAAQDATSRARLFELTSALAIAAAVSLAMVWQPAFRWAVALRNKLASEVARRWGHRLRWTSLVVVGALAGEALLGRDWGGFIGWAIFQVVLTSEAFTQFLLRRTSLIDRIAVDSVRWARRSSRLLQAHLLLALTLWTWFLISTSASRDVSGAWAILGVLVAVALALVGYLNRQIRDIEEWRRRMLTLLDDGITSSAAPAPGAALAGAVLRLETLVISGPITIGPAVEPAIKRLVVAMSITLNPATAPQRQQELTSVPARELGGLLPHEQASLASELFRLLRSRLLYGGAPTRA